MKLAAARAGLAFFITIAVAYFFFLDGSKGQFDPDDLGMLAFWGTLASGVIFFWSWHDSLAEDQEHQEAERRKALKSPEKSDKTA